jgi:hypothetical protein
MRENMIFVLWVLAAGYLVLILGLLLMICGRAQGIS